MKPAELWGGCRNHWSKTEVRAIRFDTRAGIGAGVPATPCARDRALLLPRLLLPCQSPVTLHRKWSSSSHRPCGTSGLEGILDSTDPFPIQMLEQNLASGLLLYLWLSECLSCTTYHLLGVFKRTPCPRSTRFGP